MSQLHNTTTCCYDSTVYSRLSSDTTLRSSWISSCCSNATVKGTSYYKTYCCKGTYTGQATNGSSTWDDTSNCCNVSSVANAKCCGATSTWLGTKCCKGTDASTNGTDYSSSANASKCCNYNGAATTTCCDAASSGGWTSAYGGGGYLGSEGNPKSFREKCCVLNAKYCDCKMKWEFRWNDFKSSTSCCSDLKNKSNYSGYSFPGLSGYRDVCCTGTNPGGLDKSTFQTYCCKNDYGKVRNGDDHAWCCTGSTTTSSNHDWCCKQGYKSQCRCLDNYGNAYNGNQRTECCNNSAKHDDNSAWCCSKGYNQCTCKQKWVSSCCSEGNIGYSSGNDRKACCASLYGTSGEGQLFAGAGSTCCQALGTGDNGYSSYNGKTYDKCKAPCYKSSTYSTSKLSSYKYTTNSAAYCCNYNYGLVSGGSSNSTWKSYCCKTYYSGSWNFLNSSDSYGCCNSLYSNNVYWYDPAYYGGSCSGLGGTANRCSDYKYTSAGFYCGSPNQCKAWRFQSGSKPTCNSSFSSCCANLSSAGYLSSSYKADCCNCQDFRKSSTGQSVCCSSEPSDTTLKNNCCNDNSSRSYCCPLAGASGSLDCGIRTDAGAFVCKRQGYSPRYKGFFMLKFKQVTGYFDETSSITFPTNNGNPAHSLMNSNDSTLNSYNYISGNTMSAVHSDTRVKAYVQYIDEGVTLEKPLSGSVENSSLSLCTGVKVNFSVNSSCKISGSITSGHESDKCNKCCTIANGTQSITTDTQRFCCSTLATNNSCPWNSVCCSMCAQTHQSGYNAIYEKCGCKTPTGGGGSGSSPKLTMKCTSPTNCSFYAENMSSPPSNIYGSFTSTCAGIWQGTYSSNGSHTPGTSCSYSLSGYPQYGSCKSYPGSSSACPTVQWPNNYCACMPMTLNYCAIVKYSGNGIVTALKQCTITDNKCECSITSW